MQFEPSASGSSSGVLEGCPPCGGNLDGSPADYMWMAFPMKHRLNFMIVSCCSIALSIIHFGISASANNFIRNTVTVTDQLGGKSESVGWYFFSIFGTLMAGSYWGGILVCVAGIFGVTAVHSRKASRAFVIASAILAGLGIAIGIFAVSVDSSFVAYWNYAGPESCGIVASDGWNNPFAHINYFGPALNDVSKQLDLKDCIQQFMLNVVAKTASSGVIIKDNLDFVGAASPADCYCTTANFNSGNSVSITKAYTTESDIMSGKCYDIKMVNARPDIGSYGIMDAKVTNADPQNNIKMNMAGYQNCNNILKAYPSTLTASAIFCFISLGICVCQFCYAVSVLSLPYDKTDDLPEAPQGVLQMAPQTSHEPATYTMMPAPTPMMPTTAPMLVPAGVPMGGGMAPVTFGPGGISGIPMPMGMGMQQQPLPMPSFTTNIGPKAV